ncbi:hypothetical protein V8J36_05840 [Frigidibacter sp. MR17.14]|uniref:hypothetical protein n=1 Tax=Frigidibacter sp. MR17.14 TaxID=3126509 RepID=UPI003012F7C0
MGRTRGQERAQEVSHGRGAHGAGGIGRSDRSGPKARAMAYLAQMGGQAGTLLVAQTRSSGAAGTVIRATAEQISGLSGTAGDDRLSVLAGTVTGIDTGDGNDALAISADNLLDLSTGEGDDALALRGGVVGGISTGAGNDAVALIASVLDGLDAGAGDDVLGIAAMVAGGITGGDGADVLQVTLGVGGSVMPAAPPPATDPAAEDPVTEEPATDAPTGGVAAGDASSGEAAADADLAETGANGTGSAQQVADRVPPPAEGAETAATDDSAEPADPPADENPAPEPTPQPAFDRLAALAAQDAITRFRALLGTAIDVDGGAGNDRISVSAVLGATVAGGSGDDRISLSSGTFALHYGLGDGNDSVAVGAGTDVVLQLGDGALDSYSITREGDSLRLDFAGGSVTFTGLATAGLIAVAQASGEPVILNDPMPLDLTV